VAGASVGSTVGVSDSTGASVGTSVGSIVLRSAKFKECKMVNIFGTLLKSNCDT
jgi:hypothetical protein